MALLHTSNTSRKGLGVHKVFDYSSGMVSKETIKEKERVWKLLKNNKKFVNFQGTSHNNPEIHITDYLKKQKSRRLLGQSDFTYETYKRKPYEISEKLKNILGTNLDDMHANNLIDDIVIDFSPTSTAHTTPLGKALRKAGKKYNISTEDIDYVARVNPARLGMTSRKRRRIVNKTFNDISEALKTTPISPLIKRDKDVLLRKSYNKKRIPIIL